eukprot:TRINITY_DN17996_c0_g1_i2.p1 TRINITY_DN17996_c0_g1~~TRINITY_DN17996_c0_g1_i2.p1  ORF type:complete len:106 (+),score=19.09 TRINITY_DN17996_c0_g1_i2:57-374(+)
MIRRPPRSTLSSSSAASDVYKRQEYGGVSMSNMADSERAISTEELLKNQHWVLIDGKVYDIEHFDTHPGDSGLAGPQVSRWNAHPAAEQCGPQTRAQPGLEGLRY